MDLPKLTIDITSALKRAKWKVWLSKLMVAFSLVAMILSGELLCRWLGVFVFATCWLYFSYNFGQEATRQREGLQLFSLSKLTEAAKEAAEEADGDQVGGNYA